MARLDLALLGGFRASVEPGSAIALPTRKCQALLAYLAMTLGQAHPRDKLASLLWGDMQAPQARGSLRQALTALRKALAGADALRLEGQTVALDPGAVSVDAQEFLAAVADGTPAALDRAGQLYRGDLLAGLALQEPPFEEWLLAERERLRETAMEALARLLAQHRAAGATEAAVQAALKLLALDPLQEPVHRTLMRLYVQLGRRGAALRQYQLCVSALERELRTEPESETKALYREILRDRAAAPPELEGPRAATPVGAASHTPPAETPLIGREAEMARLEELLARALSGKGILVGLDGEAGIGKSRLAAELCRIMEARGGRVLVGRCYESEQMLPFAPWVEAFRGGALDRDRAVLEGLGAVWRAELIRILPELGEAGSPVPPAADVTRTFEAVGQLVERTARRQPLLIVLEDVQWADETSIRLGAFLGRRIAGLPVLILATGREEETRTVPLLRQTRDELARSGQIQNVRVRALTREATVELARRLLPPGRAAREVELADQVWQVSEGNPFVVVETLRVLRDQPLGDAAATPTLPARVRSLIARRLERLSDPGRRLCALAAVIGRQFDFRLLQRAAGLPEHEVAEAVEELVRHQILQQSGEGLEFAHQRIRDVARGQLLVPRRILLHRAVAEALEGLYQDDLDRHALAIGMHCTEGQVWDKAAVFLGRAGLFASRLAHRDAIGCYERALAALAHLPESDAWRRQAAGLHFNLARSLYATSAMEQAMQGFRAARALAEAAGETALSAEVSAGMTYLLASEGRHPEAIEAGERALAIAPSLGDVGFETWAAIGVVRACYASGNYPRAVALARQVIERLAGSPVDRRFRPGTLLPSVGARTWLALCLTRTGDFVAAQAAAEEAVAIAEGVADGAQERAWAYYCLGHLYLGAARFEQAVPVLERAAALCENGAFPLYAPRILASLAAANAQPERRARALELLDQAVRAAEAGHVLFGHSLMLVLLATVRLQAGDAAEARRLAGQAVALTRQRGERGDEAWALFVSAEAISQAGAADPAGEQALYREALAIAEKLGIRPVVARCHLALAAIHERAGRTEAAREAARCAMEQFAAMDVKYWLRRAEELAGRLG